MVRMIAPGQRLAMNIVILGSLIVNAEILSDITHRYTYNNVATHGITDRILIDKIIAFEAVRKNSVTYGSMLITM